ncbi:DDE-type integrase/transposase/recombinase [Nocardioides litoris]|uniref:DDE-type integrase/transposase/recombinase n=1 Tax=Nocardioides litoris TaxID=1926648 RepID=UPI00111D58E0|nr:leucine zipper domain-containing protein [Nocardioides litoris]
MDWKIASAVVLFVEGDEFNVAARCRELGISRQTFYEYVARFRLEGVDGLRVRSRRPASSPVRLDLGWEEVLVRVRKQEADAGWDYGAAAVWMRLVERPDLWPPGAVSVPSRASINRVFEARGQLVRTPQRAPRAAVRRFQRERPNELWQYDGFRLPYRLGDGTRPMVLQLIDDCSRLELALQVAASENHDEVWAAFVVAVGRYGSPREVLTDNGSAFSGRRRGWTTQFEINLAALSISSITCTVGHPQTCGKGERAHQRVIKWLGGLASNRSPPTPEPSRPSSTATARPTTTAGTRSTPARPRSSVSRPAPSLDPTPPGVNPTPSPPTPSPPTPSPPAASSASTAP